MATVRRPAGRNQTSRTLVYLTCPLRLFNRPYLKEEEEEEKEEEKKEKLVVVVDEEEEEKVKKLVAVEEEEGQKKEGVKRTRENKGSRDQSVFTQHSYLADVYLYHSSLVHGAQKQAGVRRPLQLLHRVQTRVYVQYL